MFACEGLRIEQKLKAKMERVRKWCSCLKPADTVFLIIAMMTRLTAMVMIWQMMKRMID